MRSEGYKTRQRELLLAYLQQNQSSHVTVEDVVAHLKGEDTPVGKSTVYRYLDKLVCLGLVRKFYLEEGAAACYQYSPPKEDCQRHFHLKCTLCGRLFHVDCPYLSEVDKHVLSHHEFLVDHTKTVLYGVCEDCQQKLPSK